MILNCMFYFIDITALAPFDLYIFFSEGERKKDKIQYTVLFHRFMEFVFKISCRSGKDLQRALWTGPEPARMMPGVPRYST